MPLADEFEFPLDLQPHKVDLYRMPTQLDDGRGRVPNPTLLKRGIPGMLAPASADEKDAYDRMDMAITHAYHTPVDVRALGLVTGDRVMFGTRKLDVQGIQDHAELGVIQSIGLLERG